MATTLKVRRPAKRNRLALAILGALCLEVYATAAYAQAASTAPSPTAAAAESTNPQDAEVPARPTASSVSEANGTKKARKLKKLETLGAITVRGIAGSQERDIVLKRFAPQIEDNITAQNIGELPDVTISDSLSRVPGVQIGRSGGEGTTVSINGLPQVQTTLNGELFLSPGGGGGLANKGSPDLDSGVPDFQAIPATMFSGVDVIKSIMASDISGGVSGIINLKTYRPFDFHKGWTLSGAVQGQYGDRTQKLQPKGSFLASWRNDRWGVTMGASYDNEDIFNSVSEISEFSTGFKTTEADVGFHFPGRSGPLGNSITDPNDYYINWDPRRIGTSFTSRRREGLDTSIQYKFSDSLTLTADAMYTFLRERDAGYGLLTFDNYVPGRLQSGPVSPIVTPQGMLTRGITQIAELGQQSEVGLGPSRSLNTNLELAYNGSGMFSGDVRWVHGWANRNYTFTGSNLSANQGDIITRPDGTQTFNNPNGFPDALPVLQDYTGPFPKYFIYPNVSNAAMWTLASDYASRNHINAGMNVFRGDGVLHLDTGVLDSIDFGARYGVQTYSYSNAYYLTPIFPAGACSDPTGPGPNDNYSRYTDARLQDSCTGFNDVVVPMANELPPGYLTYFGDFSPVSVAGTGLTRGLPSINTDVMNDPVAFIQSLAPPGSGPTRPFMDPTNSYVIDLHEASIYTQFNLSGHLFGMQWRGNVGVRRQRSDYFIYNYLVNSNDFIGNTGSWNGVYIPQGVAKASQEHPIWLPALNFALDTTSDQQLRFAYNKTQARQDLSAMGPGLQLFDTLNGNPPKDPSLPSSEQIFEFAQQGNPNLQPYQSSNYNLSYAWFFNPRSMFYVGAFFMDVANFPETATLTVQEPDADGVIRRSGPLFTMINGGGADIRGFEGQFRTQFTSLPGLLSGLGVNLNYTYLHSTNPRAVGATHIYNAVAFYQKYGWQVRLAYNWQGKIPGNTINVEGTNLTIFQRPAGYLDASVIYDVNKNLSLFFQATNINKAYTSDYIQYPDAYWSTDVPEARYFGGVRFHF